MFCLGFDNSNCRVAKRMASSAASQSTIQYENSDQQRPLSSIVNAAKSNTTRGHGQRDRKSVDMKEKRKLSVHDFQLIKTLGTGLLHAEQSWKTHC